MLKESFQIQNQPHTHFHGLEGYGVAVDTGMSMSFNTHAEAVEFGKEKCKAGEWRAFTITKFYYWEE